MSKQRLDVKQAAEVLGISSEGVRKRIKRGTLESEKAQDGKVFVWLDRSDADRTNGPSGSDAGLHANGDPGRTEYGQGADTRSDALQSSLQDQVSYLRNQLDLERIPEIEPPRPANSKATPDPRDAPETASEDTGGDEGPPEPQEPTQRRSWLHRFFGFE